MKKTISLILAALMMLLCFVSCAKNESDLDGAMEPPEYMADEELGNTAQGGEMSSEDYGKIVENKFIKTSEEAVSTFSADVDTASYAYFRKLVKSGYKLSELISTGRGSIRCEEMINYFDYDYQSASEGELFGVNAQIAPCPWNDSSVLLMLGLKAEEIEPSANNNLVFLIDVSGSMNSADKLPLLKNTFSHLVDNLGFGDKVSIVTYSGEERVVLEGCDGGKKEMIMQAVNSLDAKGSTNGEAGLQKAYQIAEKYYISGGNNRIIMASDGDLNVGISSSEELKNYISEKKDSGIYLSVLGFGTGNYKDSKMEAIADNGNGVYYYIDGESEAEKVFGRDILSTLYTVAKDVKLQLTFSSEKIDSYRLVGYENRLLNKEDFANDNKDAGDVGAGHCVTVCYELVLTEGALESDGEWMTLAVRYKLPDGEKSELREYRIGRECYSETPDDDFKFVCAVIETSMLINESEYLGDITLEDIVDYLSEEEISQNGERSEFLGLLQMLLER